MKRSARVPLLIATANTGKLAEFERLFGEQFDVEGLSGLGFELPPEGTVSYEENAVKKARFVAQRTGRITVGDDSGLEVDALGGRPGILSARFAGIPPDDRRNIEKLLGAMAGVEPGDRSARFVCWIAVAEPNGRIITRAGYCEGSIGFEPRGSNGFGYDPVFCFPDGRTMAELSDRAKDDISHRGQAARALLPDLLDLSWEQAPDER